MKKYKWFLFLLLLPSMVYVMEPPKKKQKREAIMQPRKEFSSLKKDEVYSIVIGMRVLKLNPDQLYKFAAEQCGYEE